MSRFNYPEDFLNQTVLFKKVKAKHDADGQNSPLIAFLAQQGIDLDADLINTDDAITQNTSFESTDKVSEDYTQDRNNFFDPVFKNLKKEIQFLKKFYTGNPAELGNWGVQVDENRIVYPPDFLNRTVLFTNVKAKHDNLGANSPLTAFLTVQDIDMTADADATSDAKDENTNKEQAKADAEEYREQRDNLFNPVMGDVRKIGQFLKGLYEGKTRKLGKWGYTIDDSPRDPRFRTVTIEPTLSKTLTGAKLNSQAENTGTVELLLHKGEEVGEEPVILPPEMRFTIKRGWGTLTVENQNMTEAGEIGFTTTRQSGS